MVNTNDLSIMIKYLINILNTKKDNLFNKEDYILIERTIKAYNIKSAIIIFKEIIKNKDIYLLFIDRLNNIIDKYNNKEVINEYLELLVNKEYDLFIDKLSKEIDIQNIIDNCSITLTSSYLEYKRIFKEKLVVKNNNHYEPNIKVIDMLLDIVLNKELINSFKLLRTINNKRTNNFKNKENTLNVLKYLNLLKNNEDILIEYNELIKDLIIKLNNIDVIANDINYYNTRLNNNINKVKQNMLNRRKNKLEIKYNNINIDIKNINYKINILLNRISNDNINRIFIYNYKSIKEYHKIKVINNIWVNDDANFKKILDIGNTHDLLAFLSNYLQSITKDNLNEIINFLHDRLHNIYIEEQNINEENNLIRNSLDLFGKELVLNDLDSCLTIADLSVEKEIEKRNPILCAYIIKTLIMIKNMTINNISCYNNIDNVINVIEKENKKYSKTLTNY